MLTAPLGSRIIVDDDPRYSGSVFGYLLVGLISILLIITTTYGFKLLSGLPTLIGLTLAGVARLSKLYTLRRRSPYELNGWDITAGYALPLMLTLTFSAFTIYSYNRTGNFRLWEEQSVENRTENGISKIEDYYRRVRTTLRSKSEEKVGQLDAVKNGESSQRQQIEIDSLSDQLIALKNLYGEAGKFLRPTDPDRSSETNNSDGITSIDQDAVRNRLLRKFNEAVKFHQRLPEYIREEVELPKIESMLSATSSFETFKDFIGDSIELTSEAISCWVAPGFLEFIIFIIFVLGHRTRY